MIFDSSRTDISLVQTKVKILPGLSKDSRAIL